jgi:hypothetical protein
VIAARMAADLAAVDPANAARYQANLAAFTERLQALDQRLHDRLVDLAGKPYFVFHETYDYFEAAYGLKHAGVFSVASEVQPGARHVAAMRASLQAAGPTCVFSEPPLRPRLAQTLTAGLPVTLPSWTPWARACRWMRGAMRRCWRTWPMFWPAVWRPCRRRSFLGHIGLASMQPSSSRPPMCPAAHRFVTVALPAEMPGAARSVRSRCRRLASTG